VHLTVPDDFVIAATGTVQSGDPGWTINSPEGNGNDDAASSTGTKTVHFHAENVHDFAWCADPTFVVETAVWNGVDIHSFYREWNKAWADTSLAHGVRAMEWLDKRVGKYPYPQVSIVDALNGGGLEYPMLVMDGPVSEPLPTYEETIELVTLRIRPGPGVGTENPGRQDPS
jgi:hypothetical protein